MVRDDLMIEVYKLISLTSLIQYPGTQVSDRYITDRFLPDKAIDLIDEAAANLRCK